MLFLFGLLECFPYGLPYPADALLVRMRIHPPYGAAIGMFQTCGTWQNLTATTANTVTGAFERALDAAWGKVSTGAFDYKTAVKQAVDSLADEMPMVTYPSGHTDSIEVAARRAILTGVNQTAGKLQVARADEMGVEFFETSAHGGARPSHAEWQGRQFHRDGAVDYMGRHYPDFEAATGSRVDSARTSVPKFGRSEGSKAAWAAKKQEVSAPPSQRGSGGFSGQNGEVVHKVLGKVDVTDTKQVEALKDSFCTGYAKSNVEHMLVITQSGEVHYMTDNNPRGVDCSYLGAKLKGSYNIHTHPPETTQYSFSTDADIPAAFADGTRIMEAVDYKYRYQFAVPREITFEQWETVCEEVREEQNVVMASRGYGFDDCEENIQHVIIDETCRRLGLKCYHREKRK